MLNVKIRIRIQTEPSARTLRSFCAYFGTSARSVDGHRDREVLKNSWEEIERELGLSPKIAKDKWRSVRDRFVQAYD